MQFSCGICDKTSTQCGYLKQHEETCSKQYKCLCGEVFLSKYELQTHSKILDNSTGKTFECLVCNTNYASQYKLNVHLLTHNDIQSREISYQCTICKKKFNLRYNLKSHIHEVHSNNSVQCYICGQVFSNKYIRRRHEKIHSNENKYECNICDKKYASKYRLKEHLLTHNELISTECITTKQNSASKCLPNATAVESNKQSYECRICAARFRQFGTYRTHVKNVHDNLQCVVCGKTFCNKYSKNHHEKKHGGKAFECSFCGKKFTFLFALKIHARIHTGERPYLCDCGKSFRTLHAFNKHKKLHSKDKSFNVR